MAARKSYPNRTDLRNPTQKVARQAATGQPYGEAGAQLAAQKAVPMAAPPTQTQPVQPSFAPGQFGDLLRPTERPDEPITAGIDIGPGPGSEALAMNRPKNLMPNIGYSSGSRDDLIDNVRVAYAKYPNTALFQLLLELENQSIQ